MSLIQNSSTEMCTGQKKGSLHFFWASVTKHIAIVLLLK